MEELDFETESTTNSSENKSISNQAKIQVSSHFSRNSRRKLEDRYVCENNLNSLFDIELPHKYRYYAIFDGHVNEHAAEYCKNNLHLNLVDNDNFKNGQILEALKETFIKTDQEYCDQITNESVKSGTTALVCLIEDERVLYLAWAGDSSSILIKDGNAIELTNPHTPALETERERIRKLGGECICINTIWRVNGMLAVSRVIGDPDYKPYVTAEPEVLKLELDGSEDFLILASDGLWDSLSPSDASTIIYEFLALNTNECPIALVEETSKLLIRRSIEEGASDNITTIVIFLKDLVKISPPLNPVKQNGHHKTEIKDELIEQNGVQNGTENNDLNNYGLNVNAMPFQPNNDLFLNISMSGVESVRLMQEKANINVTSNEDNVHDDNLCAINDENSIKNDIDEQPHSILANINDDDDLERELDEERVVVKEEKEKASNNLEHLDEDEEDENDQTIEELNKDEFKQPKTIEQTVNCEYTVIPSESTASPVDLISESTTTTEELIENKHSQIEDQQLNNNEQSDVLIKINDKKFMDKDLDIEESQDDTLKENDDLINCEELAKENEFAEENIQMLHEDEEKSNEENSFEFIPSNPSDPAYQIINNTQYESLNNSKLQETSVYENAKATFDNSILDQNLPPLNEQKLDNLQSGQPNLLDSTLVFNDNTPILISPTNILQEQFKEEKDNNLKLNGVKQNNLENLTDHKQIDMDLTYLNKLEEVNRSMDQQNTTIMNETFAYNAEQDSTLNNLDESDDYNILNQDAIFVDKKEINDNDKFITEDVEESKDNFEVLEAPSLSTTKTDNDLTNNISHDDLNNYNQQTTELNDNLVNIEKEEIKPKEFKSDEENLEESELEEIKLEENVPEESKSEEPKSEETRSDEIESGETELEEFESKEVKLEVGSKESELEKIEPAETELEESKPEFEPGEIKFEEIKSVEPELGELKLVETKPEENKITVSKLSEEDKNEIDQTAKIIMLEEETKIKEDELPIEHEGENNIKKDESDVNNKPEIVNETKKEQIANESSSPIITSALISTATAAIISKETPSNAALKKKVASTSSALDKQKKPSTGTTATSKPTTLTNKPTNLTRKPLSTSTKSTKPISSSKLITNKPAPTKNPIPSKSSSVLTAPKPAISKVSSTIKSAVASRLNTASNKPTTTVTNKPSSLTSKLPPSKPATTNKLTTSRPIASKYANVTSKVSSSLLTKSTNSSSNLTNKVSGSLATKSTNSSTNTKTTTSLNRAKVNSKPTNGVSELKKEPLKTSTLKTTKPSEVKSRLTSTTSKLSSPRLTTQNKLNNSKSTVAANKSATSKTATSSKTDATKKTAVPRKLISKTQLTNNQQTTENSEINSNSIKPNSSLVNGQQSINNLTNGDQSNDVLTSSSFTSKQQDKVKIHSLKAEIEMAIKNNEIKN